MHTIQQLLSSELKGTKHLKLSCELTSFPNEIFELADTLEILDLSNNRLSSLPENFNKFEKLKIAFFSENNFTEFPEILSQCPNLTMIGFKSNHINYIPENSFPINLQWLILTNNHITSLPEIIGKCHRLQKVALAGNQLKNLPEEMAHCKNLELLRISANQLTQFPDWLFSMPRLSWLAFSGNPFCEKINLTEELPLICWNELEIKEILGEGASGVISKALWNNNSKTQAIAVKVFKGEVTSDGFPEDEMKACIAAGNHKNLVNVIGKIKNHPEQKMGLVLELIPPTYKNLAGPPNFDTCTRDTFKPGTQFSCRTIFKIAKSIANATTHLHLKGIMHGDLYAHNTLIDDETNTIFGDFGAASFYNTKNENAIMLEKIEVRAFGCLIEDLLNHSKHENSDLKNDLIKLKDSCMQESLNKRPDFKEILSYLNLLS